MDKKQVEKELSLHLNILSRMAINKDVDVSVVEVGHGTYCDVRSGKIYIEEVSEDFEILLGLGFHELGHVLATSCIEYEKEFGIPKDECELLHMQVNSLEDYRIENRIAVLYPPAEYYLKKLGRWFRLEYSQKKLIGDMTKNPTYVLHLNLDNIDLCKFVTKELRKEIRKLKAELKEKNFAEMPSTRAMFPHALDAYNRLKPFFPKGETPHDMSIGGSIGVELQEDLGNPVGKKGKPVFEEITDGMELSSACPMTDVEEGTPTQILLRFQDKVEKNATEKDTVEGMKMSKPPSVQENREYVRPYTPKVLKVTTYKKYNPDGIPNEAYSAEQGKQIGLKLLQELKFKDGERHRLDDGELNVDTVIEKMQENRGILEDFNVFSQTEPLIHDHTVLILIDMSGSMSYDIGLARQAALMLAKALEELNVPYSIRGFGAISGKLEITDYVIKDFDGALELPKLRSMFHGNQNRDSDSLRHAIKLISGERGKKLIFLISDGQPAHPDGVTDYRSYNQQAFMDMYYVIREADREGISVIGVGITDESADFIRGTYLKGFYINKIEELPEKLVQIYLQETQSLRTWRSSLL
jgi:hypothetical protein